ncbi:MAG: Gfo/Idh/MocA family oxidoreductase [Phycisphaerales bacterium]
MSLIPNNTNVIKVAIAGMGQMGGYHLNALRQLAAGDYEDYYKGNVIKHLSKISICGLCDINPQMLVRFDKIKTYDNITRLLDETKPHILIVATPTNTHKHIAAESLSRGVHTFVEKPIVTSDSDINELFEIAKKNKCNLMAGHVERYNPVSVKIVSLLKNAKPLAKNYSFVRTQKHDSRITDDIITDKLIHDLDLSLYFFGNIKNIEIKDYKLFNNQVYEILLSIQHQNGIKGTIFVSWLKTADTKERKIEIFQGGHKWKGDLLSKQLWVDDMEIKCHVEGMIKPANNQIKDELLDFIALCIEDEPMRSFQNIAPLLSLKEIKHVTKWIEKIISEINLRN